MHVHTHALFIKAENINENKQRPFDGCFARTSTDRYRAITIDLTNTIPQQYNTSYNMAVLYNIPRRYYNMTL